VQYWAPEVHTFCPLTNPNPPFDPQPLVY